MSSGKRKKSKRRQKKRSSRKINQAKPAATAPALRQEVVFKYLLSGLVFTYLLFYLFQLYASLDNTFFWADENKHAYISALVYENRQIPTILPNDDLYGNYRWSYPPLFHILGATLIAFAGPPALKYFNLMLLFIFLTSFYILIQKHYGRNEARIACLLATLAPVLATNTIRYTTEMLSMLCLFYSFFFLLVALKKSDKRHALISGISTGLLMLSKQVGIVIFGFYGLLLLWFFWKNKQHFKIMLWLLGAAVATYSPYFVWAIYNRVEVLGFASVFLGISKKPEWSGTALKIFHKYDSGVIEFAKLFIEGIGVFLSVLLLLPLYHFIRARFKDTPQNYIFFLLLFLSVIMMAWHITNERHTIILLPFIAFLGGYAFNQIIKDRLISKALIFILLVIAGYSTYQMPDYRDQNNAPQEFLDMAQLVREDPASDFRILCLRKFDALMYMQKPLIWPHARLNHAPIELLEKQSADGLLLLLKKYKVKYIVIEVLLVVQVDKFGAARYPLYFVRTCEKLERQGKIAFEAMTKSKRFILLRVI